MTTTLADVYQKAWADETYKDELLREPRAALTEAGVAVPAGMTVVAHQNSATEQHYILPDRAHLGGLDVAEANPVIGKVIARAWDDPAFKARLLADPKPAVAEVTGMSIPETLTIQVHENTPVEVHFIVPANPKVAANGELSDADLDAVAGGGKGTGDPGSWTCLGGIKQYDPGASPTELGFLGAVATVTTLYSVAWT